MREPIPSPGKPERKPSVSVVVPVFNGEAFVGQCIDRLRRQTLQDFECIFVDDFSSDGTVAAVERLSAGDSRFRLIRQPERTDPLRCRRKGVEVAAGDYVMFLDIDDEFVPEACEKSLETIRRENTDVFVFGTTVVAEPGIPENEVSGTQRFMDREPRKGFLAVSSETLPVLFGDGAWAPSVWNKIVRTDILKRCYAEIPSGRYLGYGQDFLQTVLVFLSIRSLYSDVETKLHRYHLGTGASIRSKGALTWEKFVRIMSSSNTAEVLSDLLSKRPGMPGGLVENIESRFVTNFRENAARYVWFLPPIDIPRGLELAFGAWGVDLFGTRAFSESAVSDNLEPVLRSSVFATPEGTVRTVCVLRPEPDGDHPERDAAVDALQESLASAGFRVVRLSEPDLSANRSGIGEQDRAGLPESRLRSLKAFLETETVDFAFLADCGSPHILSDLLCVRALGRGAAVFSPGESLETSSASGATQFLRLCLAVRIAGRSIEFTGKERLNEPGASTPVRMKFPTTEQLKTFDWIRWFATRPPSDSSGLAVSGETFLETMSRLASFQEQLSAKLQETERNLARLQGQLANQNRAFEMVRRSFSFKIGWILTRPFAFLVRH